MKKVLTLCMALVIVMSLSLTAFAANGFVSSPSNYRKPVVANYTSDTCDGQVILTAYADRATLPANLCTMIETAYDEIAATADLTKLTADLGAAAASKNVAVENLAVSELFDIRYEGCGDHDDHCSYDIVMKAETLDKFVSLLHFDGTAWEVVENAKVVEIDGELCLAFTPDSVSPFAIVVSTDPEYKAPVVSEETEDTSAPADTTEPAETTKPAETEKPSSPATNDNSYIALYVCVMVACVVAMAVVVTKAKKQSAK